MICDEWHCLLTLEQLKRNHGRQGLLVFPLTTERAAQKYKTKLPAYSIGLLSMSVLNKNLIEHAHRMLSLFLRNETEFASSCLVDLYKELCQLIGAVSRSCGICKRNLARIADSGIARLRFAGARYMCRLNEAEIQFGLDYLSLPWAPVVRRGLGDILPIPDELSDPTEGRFVLGVRDFPPFAVAPPSSTVSSVQKLGFVGQILKPIGELVNVDNLQTIKTLAPPRSSREPRRSVDRDRWQGRVGARLENRKSWAQTRLE